MSLHCENLTFSYFEEGKPTLQDVTFTAQREHITILTGCSGCGKSTLLYLLAGIYPQNGGFLRGGQVAVAGENPAQLPPSQRCQLVGMMFQNPELQFCMDTVENELIFCLENIQMPPEEMDARMADALDFCEITHLRHRTLLTLSGGERQKVMLACVVALSPKWLLLDEPFANIDAASARAIAQKLAQLSRERDIGILAIDHRLDHWLEIAHTIRMMEGGALLPEILDGRHPDRQVLNARGLLLPGQYYAPQLPPPEPGEIVLKLENFSLEMVGKTLLAPSNFSFLAGAVYALVGESGCGKTTLFHALAGIHPHGGAAQFCGMPLRRSRKKMAGAMGFVTQNPQDQFVGDSVQGELLFGLGQDSTAPEKSQEILRRIGLWRYREVSPYLLSQGQQRRLGVAALMTYPCRMLVCDEPTYAQDWENTCAIMDQLCTLARTAGVVVLFSTHDRQLAEDYADCILTVKEGRLHEVHQSSL